MSRLPTLSAREVTSDRLLLRKAHDTDREGLIELFTDHEVRAYLGGPRPRSDVEQYLDTLGDANTTSKPGSYVIADNTTNRLIGTLMLDRRSADRPPGEAETLLRTRRPTIRHLCPNNSGRLGSHLHCGHQLDTPSIRQHHPERTNIGRGCGAGKQQGLTGSVTPLERQP